MGLIPSPEETRAQNVRAAPNNGSAPIVPNPTAQQLENRTTATTPTVLHNPDGSVNRTIPAPGSVSTPPASTATFTGAPTGTMKAPAVITSQVGEDHLASMKTALETAKGDLQKMQLYKTQQNAAKISADAAAAQTKNGQTPDANDTQETPSTKNNLDAEISSILDGLSGGGDTPTEDNPTGDQKSVMDNDTSAIASDQEAATQISDALDSMNAGTYPLSQTEQAQVDSVRSQYSTALKAAKDYEMVKGMGATAATAASDIQMYSPDEAIGEIHAAIKQGSAKVETVNAKIIDAQAKLTEKIQSNDYKEASKLYSQISNDIKLRSSEIAKISTSLQKGTDTLQKNALAVAKLRIQSLVTTDKLDITQKRDAVNQLIKTGTLDEKTRHDAASELTAQIRASKAGAKSSTSIKPPPQSVQTTETWINGTRGADGYADPAAYKQAFDAWVGDGYQAKDFVKNYPPKDFVDPTNDWLPKYLSSKTSTKSTSSDITEKIKSAFAAPGTGFGQ